MRNKIKAFAQKKVTLPPGRHKMIILDEADRYVVVVPACNKGQTPWQYDCRGATSPSSNYGDPCQDHPLRPCM